MIKTKLSAESYVTGTNIVATLDKNTNSKYSYDEDENEFSIKVGGLTRIIANVVVTASANGTLTLQAYANGEEIPGAVDTQTVASASKYTFHINDIIKTMRNYNEEYVKVAFGFSANCTIEDGDEVLLFER